MSQKNDNRNDGQTNGQNNVNNSDKTMNHQNNNTPDSNPDQNTANHPNTDNTMNAPATNLPSITPKENTNNQDAAPPGQPAETGSTGQADPALAAKSEKTIALYRSIEMACDNGRKLREFLGLRPYLSNSDLFLALEMLFPISASKFTNDELIELFRQWKSGHIVKKTWEQYRHHLRAFSKWLGKPFIAATASDVTNYVKGKTNNPGIGNAPSEATHDHIINVLRTFFTFLLDHGYYSRLLRNPVVVDRYTNRRRDPSEIYIFKPWEYERLLHAVPWYLAPIVILLFKAGVRPETLMRLCWENIDWDRKVVTVTQLLSKANAATPILTDSDMAILNHWRHCSGPIAVFADSLQQIRKIAKDLGIRDCFRDDPRKTAISMRAGLYRDLHPMDVEAKLDYQFGNSKEVRRVFYMVHREAKDCIAYDKVTRVLPTVVLTAKLARDYRLCQIRSAVRVGMAVSERKRQHTFTTAPDVLKKLRQKELKKAWESLPLLSCFPSFITIKGNLDLTTHHLAKLVDRMDRDVSQVQAALDEIYADEPTEGSMKQGSLFHGKGHLFVPDGSISKECPLQTSSPKKPSQPDTESPKEQ